MKLLALFTCFLLTGCTQILVVHGVRLKRPNGTVTIHCIMHINQSEVTPELAQKADDFCKAIENAPIH